MKRRDTYGVELEKQDKLSTTVVYREMVHPSSKGTPTVGKNRRPREVGSVVTVGCPPEVPKTKRSKSHHKGALDYRKTKKKTSGCLANQKSYEMGRRPTAGKMNPEHHQMELERTWQRTSTKTHVDPECRTRELRTQPGG